MADSSHAPGGYYTGPPATTHDKHKAPPSKPEPEPVDGQVNAPVPGYYNGGPAAKAAGAGAGHGSTAAKEPGFLASCCACFSGGQTAN